jgi:hypothetical protein
MYHEHCFMFIILKIKDWLTYEGRISEVCFQHHGEKFFCKELARGRARSKRGGDVDGVFWYTKHVHYTYGTNPSLGTLMI